MGNNQQENKPIIKIESPSDTAEQILLQLLDAIDVKVSSSVVSAINNSLNIAGESLNSSNQ
ncbi:hypothetical protein MJO52_05405 [Microbulbifer variabilis]|uniref:Uncharacterized protein n=1 Tax=Microbulbifer variabilis TaxID=266805 RepID=A0ABY4VE37_9GAMM|nr:hypothetical protein [Microbulbifer variabilis]USD22570.1 hypothetical protein MJO52_05405 [Microbulbifer variabilis]